MKFLDRYKLSVEEAEQDQPASQPNSQPASQPGSQPMSQPGSQAAPTEVEGDPSASHVETPQMGDDGEVTSEPADAQPASQASSQPASQAMSQPGSQPGSQPSSQSGEVVEGTEPVSQVSSQAGSQPVSQPMSQPISQSPAKIKADGNLNSPTIIISAFSGCGKTSFCKEHEDSKDLESSLYSKTIDGKPNPSRITDMINVLKWHLVNNNWKYIFISSHADLREELDRQGINYYLIYPAVTRKEEFIKNFTERGNDANYIKLMQENWEAWIDEMSKVEKSYALQPGEFITMDLIKTKLPFLFQ